MHTIWHLDSSRLLAALPRADKRSWQPCLVPVELKVNQVLYEAGAPLDEVHFPLSAAVSLMYVMEDGSMMEIAEVGREGMAGISVLLDGGATPSRAIVSSPGHALRLAGSDLRRLMKQSPTAGRLLLRYAQALIVHVAQISACSRHHNAEQRLCRWLLATLDSRQTSRIQITQEEVANLLGVRRETITVCALRLQRCGLISCQRGIILVLDKDQIVQRSCECYFVVRDNYERLLTLCQSTE